MSLLVDQGTPLSELKAITDGLREKLTAAGVTSIEKLGEMTGDDLQNIPGVGPKMVEKISAAVQNYWEGGDGASLADASEDEGETPASASASASAPALAPATAPASEAAPAAEPDQPQQESASQPEASGPAKAEAEAETKEGQEGQ